MPVVVRLSSRRKRSLLNCGWIRQHWLLLNDNSRAAVEEAERLADGAGPTPNAPIHRTIMLSRGSFGWHVDPKHSGRDGGIVSRGLVHALTWHEPEGCRAALTSDALGVQARITRCVFGNPFRSVASDPRWFTPRAVTLAEAAYAGRAFGHLPELADALEEAGCDYADILSHCRGEGPHVRGCWVVDLVFGKN
jgi:hypothetical protein